MSVTHRTRDYILIIAFIFWLSITEPPGNAHKYKVNTSIGALVPCVKAETSS